MILIHALRCYHKHRMTINYTIEVLRASSWPQKQSKLHRRPETQTAENWQSHGPAGLWIARHDGDKAGNRANVIIRIKGKEGSPLCQRGVWNIYFSHSAGQHLLWKCGPGARENSQYHYFHEPWLTSRSQRAGIVNHQYKTHFCTADQVSLEWPQTSRPGRQGGVLRRKRVEYTKRKWKWKIPSHPKLSLKVKTLKSVKMSDAKNNSHQESIIIIWINSRGI